MAKLRANYNKKTPPVKGKASDVIKPKRQLFTRDMRHESSELIPEMKFDLIRIFTDMGLVLQNTHTMAERLIKEGWVKTRKIVRDA